MSDIKRPVLRYHGGKFLLAPWVISHFPQHRVYVECFAGAASVLMLKSRSFAEVYNDRWDLVVNVFEVLRDPVKAAQLENMLRLTPFSRTEFNKCNKQYMDSITDPVEKARLTIFRSFSGFGSASTNGAYSTGFRANSLRNGSTAGTDWANFPDHIGSFVNRLRGVVIENKDYREVCDQQDSKDTLVYADPPYMHDTRNMRRGNANYEHEMTDDDHVQMAAYFNSIQSMVIVSGYDNELYQQLFAEWTCVKKSHKADGSAQRVECLWLKPNTVNRINKKLF